MSAAAVVLAETPPLPWKPPVAIASPEERLRDLVHELRQPLSSIEAIAYYLEMTLPAGQFEARQYMSQLQRLVADTNTILERSVGTTRKGCARATSASVVSRSRGSRFGSQSLFHLRDFFAQLRQSRQIRELLQVFLQRARGSSPHYLPFANDLRSENAAAGAQHGAGLDARFVSDAHLSADHGIIFHHHAARESGLRGDHNVPADAAVVARCAPGCRV